MSSKMIPEGLFENDPPCGRFHHFLGCFHLNKLLSIKFLLHYSTGTLPYQFIQ